MFIKKSLIWSPTGSKYLTSNTQLKLYTHFWLPYCQWVILNKKSLWLCFLLISTLSFHSLKKKEFVSSLSAARGDFVALHWFWAHHNLGIQSKINSALKLKKHFLFKISCISWYRQPCFLQDTWWKNANFQGIMGFVFTNSYLALYHSFTKRMITEHHV